MFLRTNTHAIKLEKQILLAPLRATLHRCCCGKVVIVVVLAVIVMDPDQPARTDAAGDDPRLRSDRKAEAEQASSGAASAEPEGESGSALDGNAAEGGGDAAGPAAAASDRATLRKGKWTVSVICS
jgi:hypothetical protein